MQPVKILIVDDEQEFAIVQAVRRRLEAEGWEALVVAPEGHGLTGEDFEAEALFAVEEEQPDAVLLDVRFGEEKGDRFKGLDILKKLIGRFPKLPVLMFTQYAQGPDRETAVRGSLRWDARVDFIDKLASPEEVVLRLRRLVGTAPEAISIGPRLLLDARAGIVYVKDGEDLLQVRELQGMRLEILSELAMAWYRSPGELVPFSRLEKLSEGEDTRASLRVRVREIKDILGRALGLRLGSDDLIINVRDQGYRLVAPRR